MNRFDLSQKQMPSSIDYHLQICLERNLSSSIFIMFNWFFLGYFHFSVSWILLAVFIYLFRQRQRSQFKQRHKMLNEIHSNEEHYVKARLDELPSWVERIYRKECTF
jgi:hypothetical protein